MPNGEGLRNSDIRPHPYATVARRESALNDQGGRNDADERLQLLLLIPDAGQGGLAPVI